MRPRFTSRKNSPLVGKTLNDSRLRADYDLTVISKLTASSAKQLPPYISSKRRLTSRRLAVSPSDIIQSGDTFLVQGTLENILQVREIAGLRIKADIKLSDADLQTRDEAIAEAIVMPSSELVEQTLKQVQFRDKYNLNVLAMWRDGHPIRQKLADLPLHFGDVLLIQGRKERFTPQPN